MNNNDTTNSIDKNTIIESKDNDAISKIQNQFYREKITRPSAKEFSAPEFKILDNLLNDAYQANQVDKVKELSLLQLDTYEPSISARYCLGMIAIKENSISDMKYIRQLFEQFQSIEKWAVIDALAIIILENNPEDKAVLKRRIHALKKLDRSKKDYIPLLKKLVQIDRRDPELHLEYANLIVEEDIDEAIVSYKQATEIFAKNLYIEKLKVSWIKLIDLKPEDRAFFEKIERILRGLRQKEVIGDLYAQVVLYFIRKDDFDQIILYSKKILEYNPAYNRFKTELVRAYKEKYKNHSLLETFLKYSGLLDSRKNIQTAILSFETNIVLDKGNYIFHRSWGVGKISKLDTEDIFIEFKTASGSIEERKMDLQLALKSLKPLIDGHFWILKHENPEQLKEIFQTNKVDFFKILLRSFGNEISMAQLKEEIIEFFVPAAEWSKWWNKTKSEIVKDTLIAVSTKRKDIIQLRDNPVTLSEEAIEKFQLTQTYEDRIDIALDLLKKTPDSNDALEYMYNSIKEGLKSIDLQIQLECLFICESINKISDISNDSSSISTYVDDIYGKVKKISIKEASNLGIKFKEVDIKRWYCKILKDNNPEWRKIYIEFLVQLPIKIHKDLIKELIEEKEFDTLQDFFNRVKNNNNDYAEISLWLFKGFINNSWTLDDIFSAETILNFFRVTRMLHRIELKGTKLKNISKEIIIGENQPKLLEYIKVYAPTSVRKIVSLVKDITFIGDKDKDKFIDTLQKLYQDQFLTEEDDIKKSVSILEEMIERSEATGFGIASSNAIERMKKELEHIIKIEIPENSHEIGEAQEKGDLRENSEYKAAMERQSILQSTVTKLESEIKNLIPIAGALITRDKISIGSKIKLKDVKTGDVFVYTIMDRWDADLDRGIISYKSPLGNALLNQKVSDIVTFTSSEFEVIDIAIGINSAGFLL